MPACLAPIDFVIPDTTLLGVVRAEAGRRLHRDDPARDRRGVRRVRARSAPERANGCAFGTINALSLAGLARATAGAG